MRIFSVEYGNERGAVVRRTFTDETDAVNAFLAYFPDRPDEGFPVSDCWDLIGYVTEDEAQYGYVSSLGYEDESGHQTVSIAYTI